jgi:serine/threonine protein kinase
MLHRVIVVFLVSSCIAATMAARLHASHISIDSQNNLDGVNSTTQEGCRALPQYWDNKLANCRPAGAGGFASVLLANVRGSQTAVAIKQIQVRNTKIEDILVEIGFLARLSTEMLNAPYFPSYWDCYQAQAYATTSYSSYFTRKWPVKPVEVGILMEGSGVGDLQRYLMTTSRTGFNARTDCQIIIDMLRALVGLRFDDPVRNRNKNRAAIVHFDLKPQNVLLSEGYRAKLIDFGKACWDGQCGGARGTEPYIAPELFYRAKGTHKSDVFSMGLIIWEVMTRNSIRDFVENEEALESEWGADVSDFPSSTTWPEDMIKKLLRDDRLVGAPHDGKRMLQGMLQVHPSKRIDASGALTMARAMARKLGVSEEGHAPVNHMPPVDWKRSNCFGIGPRGH